jgi:hypothetical protein
MHGSSEVRFARGGEDSHPSGVGLGTLVRTTFAKARTGRSSPVAAFLSAFGALMCTVRVTGAVGVMIMG